MNALLPLLTVLCLAGLAVGQQTWKVNCQGGPGIDFTDLPAAVAAAAPGDTIWVFTTATGCPGMGPQPWYTAPTIDKPLSILGFTVYAATPVPGSFPTIAGLRGVLAISGIAAGQRVVVSNVQTNPYLSGLSGPSGLHVSNCAGEVVLEYFSHSAFGHISELLEIQNCANVTIRGGVIAYGGASLNIVNSTVRLSGLSLYSVPPWSSGGYTTTTPAIRLTNSTLTVTNSYIEGSNHYPTAFGNWPAVILNNSTMNVAPGANLRGGYYPGLPTPHYASGFDGEGPIPSYVYQDPRTVASGGGVFIIPQDIPATYIDFAVANDFTTVTFAGPSDGFALLLLGDLPQTSTPTPFGPLRIDPASLMFIDIVALPGGALQGFLTKDYFVPASAQNAYAYSIQSLTLSPAGVLGLTMATPFCVGWEHGRIP